MTKKKSILIFQDLDAQSPREEYDNVGVLWFDQYQDQTSEGEEPAVNICKVCQINEDACECAFGQHYLLKDEPVQWLTDEAADWLVDHCKGFTQDDLNLDMQKPSGWLLKENSPMRLVPASCTRDEHRALPVFQDEEDRFEIGLDKERVAFYIPITIYEHSGITLRAGQASEVWDEDVRACIFITQQKLQSEFNGDKDAAARCLKGEVETLDMYYRGNVWTFQVYEGDDVVDGCGGFYGDTLEESGMAEHIDDALMPALERAWDDRFEPTWRKAA